MRADQAVVIGPNAAIVTVSESAPKILVVPHDEADGTGGWDALPFGPFNPLQHRTLEIGLRSWVQEQTQLELGYVEQLYTFGDRGRHSLEIEALYSVICQAAACIVGSELFASNSGMGTIIAQGNKVS